MSDYTQICLPSGRGVRYKLLTPTECDQVLANAATSLTDDASMIQLRQTENRLGVEEMVMEFTKETGLKQYTVPATKDKDGKEVKPAEVVDELLAATFIPFVKGPGGTSYDSIFSTKDHAVLCAIYQREHGISQSEVMAIMGKAKKVAAK